MFLSVFVVVAAVIFAVALVKAFRNRHVASRRLTILLAGICISSFFLFLPRYLQTSGQGVADDNFSYPAWLRSLAYSLYYCLKTISGGQEIDVMEEIAFTATPSVIRFLYFFLNYSFFVAAPILTSSLVISLIGDLADQIRCRIYVARKCHVFSELNSNTLHLAKQIKARHPKEMLVFCSTKQGEKDLISQAKALGAAMLHAECTTAKLRLRNKHIQFYLVSPNEDQNLCYAEKLICKYRNMPEGNYVINAFAESGTGIQMVENMERGCIGVRFVDATALLCSNLLLQYPLHCLPQGCDTISVMIVGCDKLGLRILKTITWCGIAEGCGLKIRVYDKNAAFLQKKLAAQCPELMKDCDIAFISVDAQTSDLEEAVLDANTGSPDATYIIVAMGDDELNIGVSQRLSRLFRHHNRYAWTPRILTRIRNSTKLDIYQERENPYLKQQQIHPFGGVDDIFARGLFIRSRLENLAFAVDLCYRGLLPEKDPMIMSRQELQDYFAQPEVRSARSRFLQSEYNRRSSMAAALHIPAKLCSCGILPAERVLPTPENIRQIRTVLEETPALRETLAKNEHLRWNRFMRSEGYVQATWEDLLCFYPKLEKKNNQDTLSKRHLCLTDWDQLDELNARYLRLDPPEKKNFKKSDYDLVLGIPDILSLAISMETIPPEDLDETDGHKPLIS